LDDLDELEWWDILGKHLLEAESYPEIEPLTVTVEPGCAVLFSTWLLHAGCEYRQSDTVPSYRLHSYFIAHDLVGESKTINMHKVAHIATQCLR
jgi:hypothetical protein